MLTDIGRCWPMLTDIDCDVLSLVGRVGRAENIVTKTMSGTAGVGAVLAATE